MSRTIEASTYIKVAPSQAFAVLSDYASYRDWMPDVLESRLLASEGDVAVAEFFVPEVGPSKFVLEFIESSPDWLKYQQVDRYRHAGLSGRWDLEEADGGAGVVVRASQSLSTGVFRIGRRKRMQHGLEKTLEALQERALRLAAHVASGGYLEKRKILELSKTGDRLRIDFEGKTYDFVQRTGGEAP
ncbi:MAG: SRPBCC family protein [Acidobacteriota bacterium]|nr:SRPBCC family protein [Acidobacteriota bacterium]